MNISIPDITILFPLISFNGESVSLLAVITNSCEYAKLFKLSLMLKSTSYSHICKLPLTATVKTCLSPLHIFPMSLLTQHGFKIRHIQTDALQLNMLN